MANEPGGTKFAQLITEIDLDRSKYDKKLDESVEAANLATIKIEKAFKQLGVRTDQSYEQQRIAITTFYKKIIDDANVSANERVAAEQMLAKKIEAINNRQYSALNSMRQSQLKAEEDSIKQRDGLWTNMGVRSNAQIEMQKKQVMDSYNQLKTGAQGNHTELLRLEAGKNEKLKRLNEEMTGHHEMSMASMTRAVLRLYAAYYVLSAAVQGILAPLEKGFKAVETFNTSVASMAAMVVSFSERQRGMDLAGQWQQALLYSKQLVPVLETIAAKTLLSGEETTALANAFARSGVFINSGNSAQIEGFTRISNALPLMTQGQEIMRQINTEIRGLMTGANEQSSMMLVTLKAIDPEIKEHLRTWRAQGTVMENIGRLLEGFGPATAILENQWQAVKTTIDTTVTQILRGVMKPVYEEIIQLTKDLNDWLIKNKNSLQEFIDRLSMMKKMYDDLTPEGTTTAVTGGILGRLLFGSTPAGVMVGALILAGDMMDRLGVKTWKATREAEMAAAAYAMIAKQSGMFGGGSSRGGVGRDFNAVQPEPGPLVPTKEELEAAKKVAEYRNTQELSWMEYSEKMHKEYIEGMGKDYDENQKKEIKSAEESAKYIAAQDEKWREYEQKMQEEYYEGIAKDVEKRGDLERKLYTDLRKSKESYFDAEMELIREGAEEFRKAGVKDALITTWAESQISIATKKSLTDKIAAYDSANGYQQQSYDLRLLQIEDEAERIGKLTKDEAVARRYAANETDKAFIKMTRGSENFFQGTRAAFITLQEDAIRWGQVGTAVGSTFKTSLGTVMGDAIYQIIKGGFNENSLSLYAAQVGDNVLKAFTNKIGEMGSNYITGLLKPGWDVFATSLDSVWSLIVGNYQGVAEDCGQVGIIDYLRPAWNAVSDMFSNSNGTGIWDNIASGFDSAMTLIMEYWDDLAIYLSALFDSDTGSGIFGWLSSLLGYREGTFDMPMDPGHMFSSTYGPDGFAVVAHQGEMIIPANESEAIRTLLSQMGYGENFDSIISALDTQAMRDSFYEGTVTDWAKMALPGAFKGIMNGDISSLLSILNPANIFSSMFSGGFTQIAKDIFGVDPATANAGSFIGMGASSLLGLGSLGAGILVPASIFGAQYMMDLLNLESDSANRDTLRDMYGTIGGNIAYAKYLNDPTDQLDIVSQAAYAYREEPWGQNLDAAFGLYHSAASSWPTYQEEMAWQRAGMATRADFFSNTNAGQAIAGYYANPNIRAKFSADTWEQMIAEGMGQYGMAYQNPMMWKPEFTFPQYVSASTDSYLAGQDADYTAFYGTDPTFTVDPATWLYDGSYSGMHQIPPYVSSSDYWGSVLPPNYYGTGIMPNIIIDYGDYTPPDYGDLGGMRTGGVASGPDSGYPMTLHGTEAVVPLPNGRSIPVDMGDSGRPIHIHLEMNGKEVAYAVANELDTNPRLKARYN